MPADLRESREFPQVETRRAVGATIAAVAKAMSAADRKAWLALDYVGPATVRDLDRLGIRRLDQLARREPQDLYDRLCRLTRARQDPCVLDVFSMLVSRANGGPSRPWWEFSRKRLAAAKKRPPKSAPASKTKVWRVSARPGVRV